MPNETKSGRFEYEYDIYEQPYEKQAEEKQGIENLGVENHTQLNTKELNTHKSITKNKKKERKTSYDAILDEIENDQLREAFGEFIKMRKLIKSPLTDQALRLSINKLYKLSSDEKERLEIVNQSIENGWKSFYPLKENGSKNGSKKGSNGSKQPPVREETVPDWLEENQREWKEKYEKEKEFENQKALLKKAYNHYKKWGNEEGMREKSLAYKELTGKTIEEEEIEFKQRVAELQLELKETYGK